jgi:hypothetical protein
MAFFTLRLSDSLADRFDAVARSAGGRSTALRALIEKASSGAGDLEPVVPEIADAKRRVEVRLGEAELVAIDAAAAARGMKRGEWIATLVRTRAVAHFPPPRDVANGLVDAWRQLKRIGINLNQAVHAVNSARMEGSRLELDREAARIEAFRDEIDAQILAIRAALKGERAYWDAEE